MAQQLTLETTVIQRETQRAAEILFVPTESLHLAGIRSEAEVTGVLGVQLGVPIRTPDDLQDLLFASLAGRVYPFDSGSFERWRPQRTSPTGRRSADAVFAKQLATDDLVPVSSSPIRGTSLSTLITQGAAWTVSGADMLFHNPLQGLGLLALSELGLTAAQVIRAGRETLVIAVKYRLRQRLGVPIDWMPPEDRN
jgi:hypothetical protein